MSMTREQLMSKKVVVDTAARKARADLAEAKRRAKAEGYFLRPEDLRGLEDRAYNLGRKSQRIQAELSRLKKEDKKQNVLNGNNEDRMFVLAAKRRLDPEVFNDILAEAKDELLGHNDAVERSAPPLRASASNRLLGETEEK